MENHLLLLHSRSTINSKDLTAIAIPKKSITRLTECNSIDGITHTLVEYKTNNYDLHMHTSEAIDEIMLRIEE